MRFVGQRKYGAEIFWGIMLLCIGVSCASKKQYSLAPPVVLENDSESIAKPQKKEVNLYKDAVENVFGHEVSEFANISWHIRKLTNNHKQARNTNTFGEVPNSSWFTNRNHEVPLSIAEIKRGPNKGSGPSKEGPLTIIAAKVAGISPGFTLKDNKGDIYFIKFDIRGFPQLNTSAEMICTRFVYAAGYNVPENYLDIIEPARLQIAEGVIVKDRWARDVPMTMAFVEELLARAHPNPDGSYRVVASKLLPGKPVGQFKYRGRRKDDANDRIPHHHRRELRGYKVIAAWLNNVDSKAPNTLDMYVTENGNNFVRHYILDFGTTLGSSGWGASTPARGHRGAFDFGHMLKKVFSLGLWLESWEKESGIHSPSVGYFDSKLFNPGDYAFIAPNPAFQKATELDEFWGARIVMSFTDDQIRAIVETAEFENQSDEDYLAKILTERRDKTGRYWFGKVNPLDNFHFEADSSGERIIFEDLSVNAGFEEAGTTIYRYKLRYDDKDLTDYFFSRSERELAFQTRIVEAIKAVLTSNPNLGENDKIFSLRVETQRDASTKWGKQIDIYFYQPYKSEIAPRIVAVSREN